MDVLIEFQWDSQIHFHSTTLIRFCCCSVIQSCPTSCNPMDCSTQRPPCPSLSPRICSNSCLLSWWCHPTISSSVIPFSSCPHSLPASGSFPVSWLFASGGQSIGASASASVLLISSQGWCPLGLVWSPFCPRDSQESSPAPQFKSISSLTLSLLYGPTLMSVYKYWKNHTFD